jgi:hypothetical protein
MSRFFRPSMLVILSAGLALVAAYLVLWPRASDQAQPLPVKAPDQEIVWLSHATNIRDWERFVTAMRRAKTAGMELIVDESKAFPEETTEVPEVTLAVKGKKGRLLFRWYKLTGELTRSDWVVALMKRNPPPLAIIGGNTSESAITLARKLQEHCKGPDRPLFFITQATSVTDTSDPSQERPLPLVRIYPDRTFRFCFTNQQMANAVTDFVWNRDNLLPASEPLRVVSQFLWGQDLLPPADDCLRPDTDPAYLPIWKDDPYSKDLATHFIRSLKYQAARSTALDCSWILGSRATGGVPIDLAGVRRGQFRMAEEYPIWWQLIAYSVGSFSRPNQVEEESANRLLEVLARRPDQLRPLLVLSATTQPARRFLRALRKNAPVTARRFVVVTGDSMDFNKVYRDRNLTWPVLDLPLKLVFFCHRNPADRRAGFREEAEVDGYNPNEGSPTSGTEDLLLYIDIMETLVKAAYPEDRLLESAAELADNLHRVRWKNGRLLFNALGDRHGGTGEHVVYLRPPLLIQGRVAPKAEIEIWSRTPVVADQPEKSWVLKRYLTVFYDGVTGEGR